MINQALKENSISNISKLINPDERIFITGVQGLIGWNIYNCLKNNFNVVGFSKTKRPAEGEWYNGLLEDYRCISEILEKEKPTLIIHTQAMCNLDLCELKPEKTYLINVEATMKLLDALDQKKHRLIYISSEHVFSGEKGSYQEEDKTDPISVYGRTRVEAEEYIKTHFPSALIVRPGIVIGESVQGDIGPHDWLRMRLRKNQAASYFVDEFRSPIRALDLVEGIFYLESKRCEGIYHLSSHEKWSRYELASYLAKQWGLKGDIQQKYRKDDLEVPRIGDCTLNPSKASALGWNPPEFQYP